jgi:hypothetical protein
MPVPLASRAAAVAALLVAGCGSGGDANRAVPDGPRSAPPVAAGASAEAPPSRSQATPARAPRTGPWSDSGYAFNGTEPFWGGSLTGTTVRYMIPEDQFGDVVQTQAVYAADREIYSGRYRGAPVRPQPRSRPLLGRNVRSQLFLRRDAPGRRRDPPRLRRSAMIRIETDAFLPCPRERAWAVLTDFARYPEWNPLVLEAEGPLAEGARLHLLIARPDGSGKRDRLSARIVEVAAPARLAWRGSLPLFFTGRHWFALDDAPGGTRLRHGEEMSGLIPLIGGARMAASYRPGYERFNAALAARVAVLDG